MYGEWARRTSKKTKEPPIKASVRSIRNVAPDDPVEVAECILIEAEGADEVGENDACAAASAQAAGAAEGPLTDDLAFHLVILVNSGRPMRGLEDAVVARFNAVLNDHRERDGDVFATVVFFGEEIAITADRVPISALMPLTREGYRLSGCGMLLDALGVTIAYLEQNGFHPIFGQSLEAVEIAIIMASAEGVSCDFSYMDMVSLVEAKRAAGWKFSLLTVD